MGRILLLTKYKSDEYLEESDVLRSFSADESPKTFETVLT